VDKYRDRSSKAPLCRAVLLVALATSALNVHAGSFWLHTGGLSTHASTNVRNETNSGSGLEYRVDSEWAVSFGHYENSFFRESRYLLTNWTPLEYGGAQLGLTGGLVSGYYKKKYGLHGQAVPIVLPTVDYRWERVSLSLMGLPPMGQLSKGSLMLQVKLLLSNPSLKY